MVEKYLHIYTFTLNPFIKLLQLVWEEYADEIKENDLVVPWFNILGWD